MRSCTCCSCRLDRNASTPRLRGLDMMTLRKGLADFKLPMSTVWLMNDIAEAKGRQDLYMKQSPQILKALREMAMVESVESSNRIEGVTVAPDRLRPLVVGNTRPKDRSEEEVHGYRNALERIDRKSVV